MEITSVELQEKINSGKKVIVEFWAEWCGPCKMMKPLFERVASQNTSNVEMYTMNVDLNKEIGASLGIRSIPTIKVFQNSNIIDTRVGMMNEGQINGILTELINGYFRLTNISDSCGHQFHAMFRAMTTFAYHD